MLRSAEKVKNKTMNGKPDMANKCRVPPARAHGQRLLYHSKTTESVIGPMCPTVVLTPVGAFVELHS